MPIKYNLTKNDILAGKFHQLSQRKPDAFSESEEFLKAQATLIASFASAHSWLTYNSIITHDTERLRSKVVRDEYFSAETVRWKRVNAANIEEVARMNIQPSLFSFWLSFNIPREKKDLYRRAWSILENEFQKECDIRLENKF